MEQVVPYLVVDEELGSGTWGRVYKVHNHRAESFALKVLSKGGYRNDEALRREVQILARLSHPNLLRLVEYLPDVRGVRGLQAEGPGYLMEFVDGADLSRRKARPAFAEAEAQFVQALRALIYLHAHRVLHGDLKPENLRVSKKGLLKVLDFGLSSVLGEEEGGGGRQVRGTMKYLAPEALAGKAGFASDLFSLAAIFYERLGETHPYPETDLARRFHAGPAPLKTLNPEVPDYFSQILARMLEPSLERRFQSARSVLKALDANLPKPYGLDAGDSRGETADLLPWVGRGGLLEDFRERLRRWQEGASDRLCLIVRGATGTGKSRLLREFNLQASLLGWETAVWEAEEISRKALQAWAREAQRELCVFPDLGTYSEGRLHDLIEALAEMRESAKDVGILLEWNDEALAKQGPLLESLRTRLEAEILELGNLDGEETRLLLREVFWDREISPAALDFFWERSLGNPQTLLHMALQTTGKAKEAFEDPKALARIPFSLPENQAEVAARKWSDLKAETQDILLSLDLLPKEVDAALLALGLCRNSVDMGPDLASLRKAGWLAPDSTVLKFATPLLRGIPSRMAGPERSQRLADPIFGRLRTCPELGKLEAAHLAKAAGRREEFFALAREAAGLLQREERLDEAVTLYISVLEADPPDAEKAYCYAHLAAAYSRLALFSQAKEAYDRWFVFAPEDGTGLKPLKYHYLLGKNFLNMGRSLQASRELQRALKAGETISHAGRLPFLLKCHALLGNIAAREGRHAKAARHFEAGIALSPEASPEKAQLLRLLGMHWLDREQSAKARALLEESLEMSRNLGYGEGLANSASVLASLCQREGRHEEALALHDQVLDHARRCGDVLKEARTLSNMASVRIEIADYARAREHWERAFPILEKHGRDEDRRIHRFHGATLQVYLGHFHDPAIRELEAALEADPQDPLRAHFHRLLGESHRLQRDFHGALSRYAESAALFSRGGKTEEASVSLLHQLLCECLVGDFAAAARLLKRLRVAETHPLKPLAQTLAKMLGDEPIDASLSTALLPCPRELRVFAVSAMAEFFLRRGREQASGFFRELYCEHLEAIYSGLPEELQLAFEHREDYRKMAETKQRQLKATGVSRERFLSYARINKRLSEESDVSSILEQVMDAAMALAGAERGFLLVADAGHAAAPAPGFRVETARNVKKENLSSSEFQISLSIVKEALRRREAVLTVDAQSDPEYRASESILRYGLRSILAIPLLLGEERFGAVYLDHRYEVGAFTEEKLLFLKAFADQAVLALQKARLLSDLKEAKRSLERKVVTQAQALERLESELQLARQDLLYQYDEIIGRSPKMLRILHLIDKVANSRVPVWIHGESGTGKELIARALHYNSDRKNGPFIAENCSAIPENLLESVFFGHVKGAFTHADRDRMGLFEAANGGTIFLDEIGDMPLAMQSKLLRVLQEGEVRRVGSNHSVKIDVRVVSATNRNLPELVKSGGFREDLFFRLNGIRIELPPLREKREDIPHLVRHFLKRLARENGLAGLEIEEQALAALSAYRWPGNIRELENTIRNAALFAEGGVIRLDTLGFKPELFPTRPAAPSAPGAEVEPPAAFPSLAEAAREAILDAMARSGFHKGQAAGLLGVSVRHLYNLLEKHSLPTDKWALRKLAEMEKRNS